MKRINFLGLSGIENNPLYSLDELELKWRKKYLRLEIKDNSSIAPNFSICHPNLKISQIIMYLKDSIGELNNEI